MMTAICSDRRYFAYRQASAFRLSRHARLAAGAMMTTAGALVSSLPRLPASAIAQDGEFVQSIHRLFRSPKYCLRD